MTNRIKLIVAYDGTNFHGWAAQSGLRTVQGTLTKALKDITNQEIELLGASRTDSGAHAIGQVCHFNTNFPIPCLKWSTVLNNKLEQDLRVLASKRVSHEFHSRFCALSRFYRYKILLVPDPLRSRYSYYHHSHEKPSIELMQQAAQMLLGTHDFIGFSKDTLPNQNTTRHLFQVEIKGKSDEIWIEVLGTAFLKGMMRKISGAILEVGCKRRSVDEFESLLRPPQNLSTILPVMLPAHGLTLLKVNYGPHPKDIRTEFLQN